MFKNNIPILKTLNGCDELIEFLKESYQNPVCGIILFQGDIVEFDGYTVSKEGEVIPVGNVNFTVGTVNEITDTFILTVGKFNGEDYGIELPAYVREELIATLLGE